MLSDSVIFFSGVVVVCVVVVVDDVVVDVGGRTVSMDVVPGGLDVEVDDI